MTARAKFGRTARNKETEVGSELRRFTRAFDRHFVTLLRSQTRNPDLRRQVVHALSLSGIRERAFFVKLSSELCEIEWKQALPLALAAECLIASAFTADDVMDRADTRWGKRAVWKRWGNDQAWLTAEFLHGAGQIALDSLESVPAALAMRNAFLRLIRGQAAQVSMNRVCSTREAVALASSRTGELTRACFICPGLINGSPLLEPLGTLGRNMGVAFQLADDVLDFIGDPVKMGKPILHDLLNGQPNVVVAHALRERKSQESRLLARWFGKGVHLYPSDVTPIMSAVTKLGSLAYGKKMVHLFLNRANKGLADLPDTKAKSLLHGFLNPAAVLPIPYGD